jgi:conjugative transfer region protein TrbK
MRAISIGTIVRIAGYAAVALAIVAAATHFRHDEPSRPHPVDRAGLAVAPSTDPLAREPIRCRAIGMAAKDDAACASAWAENRCRFFTYAPSVAPSPSASTGKADHTEPTPQAR